MKKQIHLGFSILLLNFFWGCGSPPDGQTSPLSPNGISISPTSAVVGSADILLTVTGSNFEGLPHNSSQAMWSSNGTETPLATTFVSGTQLTAVVPANLLTSPVSAQVFVLTGDPMGDLPSTKSGPAAFRVTALPVGAARISSISPENAPTGSSDLALIIDGSNFGNQFLHTSIAFWTTDTSNLHDHGTMLDTAFVNSNQLTAVIPAALLQKPVSVRIVVLTGDVMGMSDGFFGYPESNSMSFTVTP
jgi:hypothetical protein